MKKIFSIAFLAAILAGGCKAYDSLIGHPLHVLHEQHEYNEAEKEFQRTNHNQ